MNKQQAFDAVDKLSRLYTKIDEHSSVLDALDEDCHFRNDILLAIRRYNKEALEAQGLLPEKTQDIVSILREESMLCALRKKEVENGMVIHTGAHRRAKARFFAAVERLKSRIENMELYNG